MSQYWLARAGQQYGPFSLEEIKQRVAQGQAEASDLVWTEGMAAWEPLSKIVPMRPAAPPPPPFPPPAANPAIAYPAQAPLANSNGGYAAQAPLANSNAGYPAATASADTNLIPPALHWGLVFLFSCLTFGIFGWVWALKEASFAKKLDRRSNAQMFMILALVGFVLIYLLDIGFFVANDSNVKIILGMVLMVCELGATVLLLVAAFQIRNAMVNHYNNVEPIGLRMSGALTFFFNILYIQHHYTRIAAWKRTGFIQPQA